MESLYFNLQKDGSKAEPKSGSAPQNRASTNVNTMDIMVFLDSIIQTEIRLECQRQQLNFLISKGISAKIKTCMMGAPIIHGPICKGACSKQFPNISRNVFHPIQIKERVKLSEDKRRQSIKPNTSPTIRICVYLRGRAAIGFKQ